MRRLRDYQEAALAETRAAFRAGKRAPVIVSPTGSGKTRIGAEIVAGATAKGTKVLWLAHRQELLDQADRACAASDLLDMRTIQSLQYSKPEAPGLVVIDECHHYVADQWSKLLESYSNVPRVGLTATPQRGDGRGLGDYFDAMVVAATPVELRDRGLLVPCEILRPSRLLGPGELAQHPVNAYNRYASGRKAIVFSQNVAHAKHVTMAFGESGVVAEYITGSTAREERDRIVRAFCISNIDILVSVNVLTEGFDAPETSCCIIARGCSTAMSYLQMIGRVLRPSPGKDSAIVLDLRGASHVHGDPYDDRSYSLSGLGIRRKEDSKDDFRFCQICSALLSVSDTGCDACGWVPTSTDRKIKDLKEPLEKYAAKRAEDESKRIATYNRWRDEGRRKGYKPGWARSKYVAVYGVSPPNHRSDKDASGKTESSDEVWDNRTG